MQRFPVLGTFRRLKPRIILPSPHKSPAGSYQQERLKPRAIPATARAVYSVKSEPGHVMRSDGLMLLHVLVVLRSPSSDLKSCCTWRSAVRLCLSPCRRQDSPTAWLLKRPVDNHNHQPLYQRFNSPIAPHHHAASVPIAFAWCNENGEKIHGRGGNRFKKKEGIGAGGEGTLLTLTIICNIIFDLTWGSQRDKERWCRYESRNNNVHLIVLIVWWSMTLTFYQCIFKRC